MPENRCSSLALTVLLVLSTAALPARAQQAPEPVRDAVARHLERETAGLPGRIEIEVGPVDPGNQLPACAALGAFFPAGTRAWGRISVGVRCESPVSWTIYVPARVAVMTEFLVTARPLRPGQIVGHADLERRFGDLAAEPASTLTELAQAVGQRARYAVAAGNTLRADMLRLPPAVKQGQTVKIVGSGGGFSVSNEGRALNAAAEGEAVRVRLNNGQVVSGTARGGGVVEVSF
jgi:flagella basal body P-ring formation protein FlgA